MSLFLTLAGLLLVAPGARAQTAGSGPSPRGRPIDVALGRVSLRGGLLFTQHETLARVDSHLLGTGTLVDVERDLGLDDATRDVRFDAAFRIGRRHQIQAGYLELTRHGGTRLTSRIQWGDAVLTADVDVDSRVEMTLVPVAYRFSVFQTDRIDVGISGGVFALLLDADVTAPAASVDEGGSAEFPLPVVGVDGLVALVPRVFLTGGAKYFALRVGGVDGAWREFRTSIEVFPLRNAGIGLGYRIIRLEADGTGGIISRPEGELLYLDYEFAGPSLYVTLSL